MDTVIKDRITDKVASKYIFMQNKVFLDDIVTVAELCSKKCIKDYNDAKLNPHEQICLEKCYFKTIDMNNYISSEFPNIFPNFKLNN